MQVITHLCTRLTLIRTNKGFKGFYYSDKSFVVCAKAVQINTSLTGHVYRVSHVFFSLSLASISFIGPSKHTIRKPQV
jgi:hypothetical protein